MLANHPNVLGGGATTSSSSGGTGLFADGTVAAPSISFLADQDTGIYRIGANNLGVAAGGVLRFRVDSGGITSLGLANQIQTTDYVDITTGTNMQLALLASTGNTSGKLEVYTQGGAAGGVLNINTQGGGAVNFGSGNATFGGAVVAPSLTAPASTALALAAGSGNQNITLTPSGTGVTSFSAGDVYIAGSGKGLFTDKIVSYTGGSIQISAGAVNVLIGTNINSGNGILQLSTNALATTSAYGIGFGTDVSLYRAAANVLALDSGDALQLGNQYVNTVAVSTGTVTIRDSTGTVYRLLCVV